MPILSMSAGRVTAIWGSAYYRQQDGSLQPVRVGDDLIGGQQILTDQDGIVEIEPAALSPQLLKLIQAASELDHTLKAVDAHDADVAPAAGLDASGSGSLVPGIRVDRVAETLSPSGLDAAVPPSDPLDRLLPSASMVLPVTSATQSEPHQVSVTPPAPDGDATLPPGERAVSLLTLSVSEAGLSGHASADTAIQTTQLDLAGWPGVTGLHLLAPSMPVLTDAGSPLVWLSDGHGGLLAKVGDDPAAPNVLTAGLDPASGRVTVALLAPVQHPGLGQDALTLDFSVRSDEFAAGDVAVVQVAIQDDVPVAGAALTMSATSPQTDQPQPNAAMDTMPFAAHGSLLDGVSIGADGLGHVLSLVVNGHTYLADLSAPDITIHTRLGCTLTVNVLTGQYSYAAPSYFTGSATEAIVYTVADKDGDTVSATLHAVVNPALANAVPQALDLRDVLQSEHVMSATAQVSDHHLASDGHMWLADQSVAAHAASAALIHQLLVQGPFRADI